MKNSPENCEYYRNRTCPVWGTCYSKCVGRKQKEPIVSNATDSDRHKDDCVNPARRKGRYALEIEVEGKPGIEVVGPWQTLLEARWDKSFCYGLDNIKSCIIVKRVSGGAWVKCKTQEPVLRTAAISRKMSKMHPERVDFWEQITAQNEIRKQREDPK